MMWTLARLIFYTGFFVMTLTSSSLAMILIKAKNGETTVWCTAHVEIQEGSTENISLWLFNVNRIQAIENALEITNFDTSVMKAYKFLEFQFLDKNGEVKKLSDLTSDRPWIYSEFSIVKIHSSRCQYIISIDLKLNQHIDLMGKLGMRMSGTETKDSKFLVQISNPYLELFKKFFNEERWLPFDLTYLAIGTTIPVMVEMKDFLQDEASSCTMFLFKYYEIPADVAKKGIGSAVVSSKCYLQFFKNDIPYRALGQIGYIKEGNTIKVWIENESTKHQHRNNGSSLIELLRNTECYNIAIRKRNTCEKPEPSASKQWIRVYTNGNTIEASFISGEVTVECNFGVRKILSYAGNEKINVFFHNGSKLLTIMRDDLAKFEKYRAASECSSIGTGIKVALTDIEPNSDPSVMNVFVPLLIEANTGSKNAFGFPIFQWTCII